MYKKKRSEFIGTGIGIVIFIIICPFLYFWFGFFDGWLAKLLIGNSLSNALNSVFNTTYFNKDMLPMLGGVLGWISGFFKQVSMKNNKD